MRIFKKWPLLLVLAISVNAHAFEFKSFQSQLENAQKGMGKFLDGAQKAIEKEKQRQLEREKRERENEASVNAYFQESKLARTNDSSYLVKIENLDKNIKWLMIDVKKMIPASSESDTMVVKLENGKFQKRIYFKEGKGEYQITYFTTVNEIRTQGTFTYLDQLKVQNDDSSDKSFLLPSLEVQSDDSRIIEIARKLSVGATDQKELVKRIHYFVASTIRYNDEGYADGSYVNDETDALTVLNTKKTVCAGYSSFFAAIARASGIKTAVVHGPAKIAKGWELHAWNEVFIDGKWESLDVTWDDQDQIIYDYFLIDAEKLKEDHKKESVKKFF